VSGKILHRKPTTLPDDPTADISSDEWNDSLKVTEGITGQFFVRDTAALDGWSLHTLAVSDLPDLSGTTLAVQNLAATGWIRSGPADASTPLPGDLVVNRGGSPGIGTVFFGGSAGLHWVQYNGPASTFYISDTLAPSVDNARDLGLAALRWRTLYVGALDVSGAVTLAGGLTTTTLTATTSVTTPTLSGPASGSLLLKAQGASAITLNINGTDRLVFDGNTLIPVDNATSFGTSTNRFKNLYLAGSLIVGPVNAATPLAGDLVVNRGGNPGTGYVLFGGSASAHYIGYNGTQIISTDTIAPTGAADLGTTTLPWRQGVLSTALSVGTNPATVGAIRLANNTSLYFRNSTNDADVRALFFAADSLVYFGTGIRPLNNSAYNFGDPTFHWSSGYFDQLVIGTNPASNGDIRLPSNATIMFRNADNTKDQVGMTSDGSNLILGFQSTVGGYIATNSIILRAVGVISIPTALTIGALPATNNGGISMTNGQAMYGRNAANTANAWIIGFYTDNTVHVGDPTVLMSLRGTSIGASAAIVPNADNTYALGSAAIRWSQGYFATVTVSNLTATTLSGTTLNISGPGPHVIGGPATAQYRFRWTGNFAGQYGTVDDGTINPPPNAETTLMALAGTIALPASGVTPVASAVRLSPAFTTAGATADVLACLYVQAVTTSVTANSKLSIWSNGPIRCDQYLSFGAVDASHPGLRGVGALLQAVVGGGTNYADFEALTLHSITSIKADSVFSVGTNPSTTGTVRLPGNANGNMYARNAANTGDLFVLGYGADNVLYVGSGSGNPGTMLYGAVAIGVSLAVGALPAQSGPVRIPYNTYLTARESSNTADRRLIGFGQNVDLDADAAGVSFHGGRSLIICPADGVFELHNRGGTTWAQLFCGQLIARSGSIGLGNSVGLTEFAPNSVVLGSGTTITCIGTNFAPVATGLVDGYWWVEATGTSPARQLRLAVRDGGVTYYQNIGAAH
jgi:hypothetical protein